MALLRFLLHLVFSAALIAGVACSKPASQQAQIETEGGQDGGGGDPLKSTSKQVFEAIQTARSMVLGIGKYSGKPVFPRAIYGLRTQEKVDRLKNAESIFWKMARPKVTSDLSGDQLRKASAFRPEVYLLKSKFIMNDTDPRDYKLGDGFVAGDQGPCKSNHGDVAASVSQNSFGADICFSVAALEKYSPQSLLKEVFALLIHEIAHLNGFGEEEANLVQTVTLENFEFLQFDDGSAFRNSLRRNFQSSVRNFRNSYKSFKAKDLREAQTLYSWALGRMEGIVDSINNIKPEVQNEIYRQDLLPELQNRSRGFLMELYEFSEILLSSSQVSTENEKKLQAQVGIVTKYCQEADEVFGDLIVSFPTGGEWNPCLDD